MSDKMYTIFNSMKKDFKSKGFNFSAVRFMRKSTDANSSDLLLLVDYKAGSTNSTATFNFTLNSDSENCNFTYTGCDSNVQNMLNMMPALQEFINVVSSMKASANVTLFDLSSMKFTLNSDNDVWYIVSL